MITHYFTEVLRHRFALKANNGTQIYQRGIYKKLLAAKPLLRISYLRKNIETFGATLPEPCVLRRAGFMAERVCGCVIVSICQDKQGLIVYEEKKSINLWDRCGAEVGFDWLTGKRLHNLKQFV